MEVPDLFRCPISMELMEDPVTVATGVTYERKNIEKWLFVYKKSTCPATMMPLQIYDLTPNHTLGRLIASWRETGVARLAYSAASASTSSSSEEEQLVVSNRVRESLETLLKTLESSPFKVSTLKKIRTVVGSRDESKLELMRCGGVEALARVVSQLITAEMCDFTTINECESAVNLLHLLPLADDEESVRILSDSECVKPMIALLQRGSIEARLQTLSILQKMATINRDWRHLSWDTDAGVFISLLELLSDEISSKLSASALDVLIEIASTSKKSRVKLVESGAVRVLLELLPDANRHRSERILLLLKKVCQCPEGRSEFVENGLGVAVVSKKILRVSETATKLGVKILWLVCSYLPTEKVLQEMVILGGVRKLLLVLHIDGRSSTKEKAIKILRTHGGLWKQYPCFPCELNDYLKLLQESN